MSENSLLFTASVDKLHEDKKEILNSLSGVRNYMRINFKGLVADEGQTNIGGWSQFLEEKNETPSVTGTSCLLASLITCGETAKSPVVMCAKEFILINTRPDGGWTKPSLAPYFSLVRETCLAMRALLKSDVSITTEVFQNGASFLIRAQNDDGGWGNLSADNESDVTSTAYAMQILTLLSGIRPDADQAVARGKQWLLDAQNSDGSWGCKPNQSGTLSYSSHAVEALIACGMHSEGLSSVREWINKHLDQDSQFLEHYRVPLPNGGNERKTWTHLSTERALIALLKLNVSVSASGVQVAARKILARQVNETYWRVDTIPNSQPAWAILEAVNSLTLYLDYIDRDRIALTLNENIMQLKSELQKQDQRIQQLERRMEEASFGRRVIRFGRLILSPVPALTIICFVIVIIYLLSREMLIESGIDETIIAILGVSGFVLTIYQVYDIIKRRSK